MSSRVVKGDDVTQRRSDDPTTLQFDINVINISDLTSEQAMRHNCAKFERCCTCVCALAGTVAGILGMNGLIGFAFYFMATMGFSTLLYAKFVVKRNPSKRCFVSDWYLLTSNHPNGICTYILLWTFIYGIVHAY
ncbi:hypothetical protein ACOME3_009891 [Neoechinorhynchus agilis]